MGIGMKWTPVLELGCEGGSIVLEGQQDAKGSWFFRFGADESALAEIFFSEDAKPPAEPKTSEAVKGLDAALESLGERYMGWADLYPLNVHPKFAARICTAALYRCEYTAHRWEEITQSLYFMPHPIASPQEFEKTLYGLRSDGGLSDTEELAVQYRKSLDDVLERARHRTPKRRQFLTPGWDKDHLSPDLGGPTYGEGIPRAPSSRLLSGHRST